MDSPQDEINEFRIVFYHNSLYLIFVCPLMSFCSWQRWPPGAAMFDWYTLNKWSDAALARVDIVRINAICAAGLPGIDRADADGDSRAVDEIAASCHQFTERTMSMFRRGKCDYPNSEPKFRIQAMITHIQRDLNFRYHPDRQTEDAEFQPADSFLYGLLHGAGGTCGSLPVLYAAVGRRLGYPISLVTTKCHLFCRWDGQEQFNIEGAGHGVSFHPDEHFRRGRFEMPPETIKACGYLESLSPREEIAGFLAERGECWMRARNYKEAVHAFAWANEFDSRRQQRAFLTDQAMRKWDEDLRRRLPAKFPKLDIGLPAPQFHRLPRECERQLIRMRVMENLLNDDVFRRQWWEPLRRNPSARLLTMPAELSIDYRWEKPSIRGML